jgi:hypothetical protein
MLRVTTVQAAPSGEAVSPALDGFEVEYVTEDGAAHRVELSDAWPVRFELARPVRALRSRRGSGICLAAGGRPRTAATWGMSRGWNVTM